MLTRASAARICSSALLALIIAACGGQSLSSNDSMAGKTSAEAGTHQGGNGNVAGSSPKAGASQGGKSAGGASSTGGAASDEACSGPPTVEPASCSAAFSYYTHDAETGLCLPFLYGGCGGTKNLHKTLAECQAACPGGPKSFDACEQASDCTLGSVGCCGACDGPSITTHDFVAHNHSYTVTCPDIPCAPCPPPEGELTRKYFVANCVENRCIVEDLRESELTACEYDRDCMLRHGSYCCESCGSGSEDAIAVRTDGSFEAFVCGEQPMPCPACAKAPFNEKVVCDSGQCAIVAP